MNQINTVYTFFDGESNGKVNLDKNHKEILDETKKTRNQLIKQVVLSTLNELVVSSIFTGITCLFVASPAIPTLIITTIAILAFGILLRTFTASLAYRAFCKKHEDPQDANCLNKLVAYLKYLNPTIFVGIDIATRDCLIHEGGHALAAMAVYKNSHPKIEIFPFISGVTRYSTRHLSRLGEFLGENSSKAFVSGAGAGASILVASLHIGLAHRFRERYPEFSRYCTCTAIASIFQHVIYALSAFIPMQKSGHDFVSLWATGIHPVASITIMISVPLIVKTGFYIFDHMHQTNSKRNDCTIANHS